MIEKEPLRLVIFTCLYH